MTSGSRLDHAQRASIGGAAAARQHGLKIVEVEHWHNQYPRAAENGLRPRPKDEEALKEGQIKKLKKRLAS